MTYLLGVNGIVAGCEHLFFADQVADSIGWSRGTPWQWEVGLGDLAYGIPGVMAGSFDRQFWLATIIAASGFLIGAAVGHVRELVRSHNFSPGNGGPILFTDVALPVGPSSPTPRSDQAVGAPGGGLEPPTSGSKGQRSAD